MTQPHPTRPGGERVYHVQADRDAYVADTMNVYPPRSPARSSIRVRAVVLSLTLIVGAIGLAASGSSVLSADTADVVRDTVCTRVSPQVVLQNHHSRLYLVGEGEPRLGSARWALKLVPLDPSATECVVSVHSSAERTQDCLTADPNAPVRWSPCEDRQAQLWIVEQHWRNAYYEWWEHLRPLSQAETCLQPRSTGGSGTSLVTAPCGEGWLQQWKLATS